MRTTTGRSGASSLILLSLAILALLTSPAVTETLTLAATYLPQTTTISVTTSTSSTTATSETSTQTTSTSATATTTTTSTPDMWDVLIPVLMIGIGAGLSVLAAGIVIATRRRRSLRPTVHLICPRCRAPINPYDPICRTCGVALYHPYRFYPQRR